MANPPTPPNSNPSQLSFQINRLSIVTVNGVDYSFTVRGSTEGQRYDKVVKNLIKYHIEVAKKPAFESIHLTLQKTNQANPGSETRLASSQVVYNNNGVAEQKDFIEDFKRPNDQDTHIKKAAQVKLWGKVNDNFTRVLQISPNANAPQQPPQSNNNPPQPPSAPANPNPPASAAPNNPPAPVAAAANNPPPVRARNDLLAKYQARISQVQNNPPAILSETTRVDYTLADQLRRMPNNGGEHKYHSTNPDQHKISTLAEHLRDQYATHIKNNKTDYSSGPKFEQLFSTLKLALQQDKDHLNNVITKTNGWFINNTKLNSEQIRSILESTNRDSTISSLGLSKDQAISDLITIHNEYTKKGKILNDTSFLEAFVKIHKSGNQPNLFSVVVFGTTDAHTPYLAAQNTGHNENTYAFLYKDAQGRYFSLPRSSSSDQPISLPPEAQTFTSKLNGILKLYNTYSPQAVKAFIKDSFATQHSNDFDAIKFFIYKHDVEKWTRNAGQGPKPGEGNLNYGGDRFNEMSPQELQSLLVKNRDSLIRIRVDRNATGVPIALI